MPAAKMALSWMKTYFQRSCEKLPNKGIWHLPAGFTKENVFDIYFKQFKDSKVSKPSFYRLWKKNYAYVKIPKQSRFSKCDFCLVMKEEIDRANDPNYLQQLEKLFNLHIELQAKERTDYYDRINDAVTHPKEKMSIIIDGMDQSKLIIPQFKRNKKCTDGKMFLPTHLSAAKVHGEILYGQFDYMQYKHDSNMTCNLLMKTLLSVDKIPDVLFLQMDNCWRENKNKFVFAFLCYLLFIGVFTKIYVHFLMVGHTHEDIDQVFSVFARMHLRNKNVLTLDDLMNAWNKLPQSYEKLKKNLLKKSVAVLAEKQYDYKSFLEPHINPLHGQSGPHSFVIQLSENGTPIIKYKQWSSSSDYLPENGIKIFKDLPNGKPPILKPNIDKVEVDKIKQNVNAIINNPFIESFDDASKDWWEKFWPKLENLSEETESSNDPHDLDVLLAKKNSQHPIRNTQFVEDLLRLQDLEDTVDNPVAMMSINRKRPTQVQEVNTRMQYEAGKFAAVFHKDLIPQLQPPIIGKIENVWYENGKRWILIKIWSGSYENPFVQQKPSRTECLEYISIVCYDFKFIERNKAKYLQPETIQYLKRQYANYLNQLP